MTVATFLELIEFKAKTASIFPFMLGLGFSYFHYGTINPLPLTIYFFAMLLFNMFVDVWDNYNDYHKAIDTKNYKQQTNIIGRENISLSLLKKILAGLFFLSLVLGLITAQMTGMVVFYLGLLCYFVGVFYSGGPYPLSRLPFGEFLSGTTMGFFIFLICVYINASQVFIWDIETLLSIFLVSLPNTLLIGNLMLANNTCDLQEDRSNHRYTIVHYIGPKNAVIWWTTAIIISYLAIILAVVLRLTPFLMLGTLTTIPFVTKQAYPYMKEQSKRKTFIASVRILAVVAIVQALLMCLGAFVRL